MNACWLKHWQNWTQQNKYKTRNVNKRFKRKSDKIDQLEDNLKNANEGNVQVKELSLKQQESNEKLVFSKCALQKEMTKVKKEQLNFLKTINEQETLINLKKVCRHS